MKTKIALMIFAALAVICLSLAASADNSQKSDMVPAAALRDLQTESKKTQTELQQALARIAALERRLSSVEQAIAKLEKESKDSGQPRLTPLEGK